VTVAYATEADLADWLPADVDIDGSEAARLLQRAAELLDDTVRAPFSVDSDTSLPTDADVAAALRDASCAQVEFWAETSEEHDVDGLAGSKYSVGGYSGDRAPELAPRALRALNRAGLMRLDGSSRLIEEPWPA